MLDTVGVKSLEDLYSGFEDLRTQNLNLPPGKSQMEVIRFFTELASQNKLFGSIFRGAGAYCHYRLHPLPSRNVTGHIAEHL